MSYKISFHHNAELEYEHAWEWYLQQQPGLEEKFFEAINKKLQQIIKGPELYSVKNSSNREAIVPKFPYVIVYNVNKRKKIINVVAIHHTSRKPKKKYRN